MQASKYDINIMLFIMKVNNGDCCCLFVFCFVFENVKDEEGMECLEGIWDLGFRMIGELESVNGMMFDCCKNSE